MANTTLIIQQLCTNATVTTPQIIEATKVLWFWPLLLLFLSAVVISLIMAVFSKDAQLTLFYGFVFLLQFIVAGTIFVFSYFWPVIPAIIPALFP